VRVVIAEDQALMRDGLTLLLERNGFEVAAAATDGEDLVRRVRAHRPQLVLTDIRMPPTHTDEGLTAALTIRRESPGAAIAVLSQHVQRDLACELLESADHGGGIGYMLKQRVASRAAFCADLKRVGEGGAVLDPEVVSAMLRRPAKDDAIDRLTPRQLEVLTLMAEGRCNSAIAEQLFLSEKAVLKHVAHIYGALGLQPCSDDHRRVAAVVRFLNR
jgi:DNA-binding NarL/FixJ family response regulator